MRLTLHVPGLPAVDLKGYKVEEFESDPRQWFKVIKAGPVTTTYKCWTDSLIEFDMELKHGSQAHIAMGNLEPSSKSPFSIESQ